MKEPETVNAVTRHLLEAIEQIRDDVAKVEFWAGAVAGFARPVPEYSPGDASVWLPTEQGSTLQPRARESDRTQRKNQSARSKKKRARS